jgi:hypothetical protein
LTTSMASTATTASTAATTTIVLSETVLKTLAPSMIHARMERTGCIKVRAHVEA